MRVTDPVYSQEPIKPQTVETVLSTITALEAGAGPKLATDYQGRLAQMAHFSGQPTTVVEPIYQAYQRVGDIGVATSKKVAPEATQTATTTHSKLPTIIIVGGLAALLLGILIPIMAKKASSR